MPSHTEVQLGRIGGKAIVPLTKSLIAKVSPEDRVTTIEEHLMGAIRNSESENAEQLLALLGEAYLDLALATLDKETTNKAVFEKQKDYFWSRLRPLFWQIPPHDHFSGLRLNMIKLIAKSWTRENDSASVLAFRFMVAVVSPRPKSWPIQSYESEDERQARTDALRDSRESEKIVDLFRERIKGWDRDHLAFWLEQPGVPEEMIHILATEFTHATLRSHQYMRDFMLLKATIPQHRATTIPLAIQALQDLLAMEKLVKEAATNFIVNSGAQCKDVPRVTVDVPNTWKRFEVRVHFPEADRFWENKQYTKDAAHQAIRIALTFFLEAHPQTRIKEISFQTSLPYQGAYDSHVYKPKL